MLDFTSSLWNKATLTLRALSESTGLLLLSPLLLYAKPPSTLAWMVIALFRFHISTLAFCQLFSMLLPMTSFENIRTGFLVSFISSCPLSGVKFYHLQKPPQPVISLFLPSHPHTLTNPPSDPCIAPLASLM